MGFARENRVGEIIVDPEFAGCGVRQEGRPDCRCVFVRIACYKEAIFSLLQGKSFRACKLNVFQTKSTLVVTVLL